MTKLKMLVRLPTASKIIPTKQAKMAPSPEKKSPPKNKKARLSVNIEMPEGNDRYCWECHGENATVPCKTCQRSFHETCAPVELGQDLHNLVCTECMAVIRVEKEKLEGTAKDPLSKLSLAELSELLLFVVKDIRQYALEVFHDPVPLDKYPDYKDHVVKMVDLKQLEQNTVQQKYSCVEQFIADLKWIVHNSSVFNGLQNRFTSSASATLKAAQKEIHEMSLCPQCYLMSKKDKDTSFSEPCTPPHIIVWAKIKGFPFWPAKVMKLNGDTATVKFFGDHFNGDPPLSYCILLTVKPPVNQKSKKGHYNQAMEEINAYIKKYRERFGVEFRYETEKKKLTREIFENQMNGEFCPEEPMICDVKKEAKEEEDDDGDSKIKAKVICDVPALLAGDEEDKDSGSEEQNSILESIKRKLNLDKKNDSTDEDKEEEKEGSAAANAPNDEPACKKLREGDGKSAEEENLGGIASPNNPPLGVDDTPKSPERTNCAEVSSTTADADPPTLIPQVASGNTFFEKLRQTIEECKEKVGVTQLSNLPPVNVTYDESDTDVSDTEIMPYQQRALPSPKKDQPLQETEKSTNSGTCVEQKREQQTQTETVLTANPLDRKINQELVAREIALLKDKFKFKEIAAHKAIWHATTRETTDMIKAKQWCCVCKALATMTCCWNTSYCSPNCQSSHWPAHIKSCERSQPSKR